MELDGLYNKRGGKDYMLKEFAVFIVVSMVILFVSGCSSDNVLNSQNEEINTIIDAAQFSRITPDELVAKLGEPKSTYDEKWTNPGDGKDYPMKTYDYDVDGYYTEFLVIENAVVRMNIYASDNDKNQFFINNNKDILSLLGIEPRESLVVVEDNNAAAKYSSVSDKVGEVWAMFDEKKADILKVTFNLNYFN
jgi:hypothetical protein